MKRSTSRSRFTSIRKPETAPRSARLRAEAKARAAAKPLKAKAAPARPAPAPKTRMPEQLRQMDAYWRASNYLSVGQIYLMDNPLLKTPLTREHIKPRLLGHWGTTPGLNFIYVHL